MGTKYKGTKKEITALNAFINLMRCVNSMKSRLNKNFIEFGLTESQFGVLEALFHLGPLSQKELAKKLLVTGGNITMVIDNLEKENLVKRTRDEDDRRFLIIKLTNKGNNLIAEILPKHVDSIVNQFQLLSLKEQIDLRNYCRKIGRSNK
ncbi:MAG: MarR family transcriptional regulator [Candidatus Dadabacteria bacterium]|nr:MarR family transcriptional regulator [Candidatus Dadabacteria bacterium]NIQ16629.1 MarR family transcriptional regulator [Candidatus Dadabacteria bacterium]